LLSDFTAPVYADTSLINHGTGEGMVYTLTYASASPGKSVNVRFTGIESYNGFANVTLQAATLVTDNNPPAALIVSPTNQAIFLAPASMTIHAAASDSDGSISKVEFFAGALKIGETVSAPHVLTWTNAPLGSHSLKVRATDDRALTFTSQPVDVFVSAGGGLLTGSVAAPAAWNVNLSLQGRTDWAHWGLTAASSFNRRRLVPQRIGNFTKLGSATVKRYTDNAVAYSWTNGTPALTASDTRAGVFITGLNNGFQLAVKADAIPRRLKMYVGLYGARGRMEAWLSDASAVPYRDDSLAGVYNSAYAVHTIDFAAASTNQTLFVRYTAAEIFDSQFGNVTWQAGTLSLPALRLRNTQSSANQFGFSFPSEPDVVYTVLRCDSLDTALWMPLTNMVGTGNEMFFVDPAAPLPAGWYQVVAD
jgi:hypothetical protein